MSATKTHSLVTFNRTQSPHPQNKAHCRNELRNAFSLCIHLTDEAVKTHKRSVPDLVHTSYFVCVCVCRRRRRRSSHKGLPASGEGQCTHTGAFLHSAHSRSSSHVTVHQLLSACWPWASACYDHALKSSREGSVPAAF